MNLKVKEPNLFFLLFHSSLLYILSFETGKEKINQCATAKNKDSNMCRFIGRGVKRCISLMLSCTAAHYVHHKVRGWDCDVS